MAACKEFSANLLDKIAKLDNWRDITLVAGKDKQRFLVHRFVLAASSEYFQTLFSSNYNEERNDEIIIMDIDGPLLKQIVDYCYTGRITLTEENVDDILAAATLMELTMLQQKCDQFWELNFSGDNLVFTLQRADKYDLMHLRQKALDDICDGFESVPIAELKQLDAKLFHAVLSSGRISHDETVFFDRLVHWVDENEIERAAHVPKLFTNIKLKLLPMQFLKEKVEPFCDKYGCTKSVLCEYRKRLTECDIRLKKIDVLTEKYRKNQPEWQDIFKVNLES